MYTWTSAAILNSINTAASSSRSSRRTRADDREYSYDLFYSLLEEGRRNPRPALADDHAAAGGGRREAKPAGCCPLGRVWKIVIRSFVVVVSLLVVVFLSSLVPTCQSWSDAFRLLVSMFMLVMIMGFLWASTLDCATDPEYHRKRRTSAKVDICEHVDDIN